MPMYRCTVKWTLVTHAYTDADDAELACKAAEGIFAGAFPAESCHDHWIDETSFRVVTELVPDAEAEVVRQSKGRLEDS